MLHTPSLPLLSKHGANSLEHTARNLLANAGIEVNGPRPWDIQVHDERSYHRIFAEGSLGLGESYMDGWWDCDRLDQFFERVLRAHLDEAVVNWRYLIPLAKSKILNLQRRAAAFAIGESHYDLGNDLFEAMLDRRMVYSCGYWRIAENLDQAQEAKLDLICRKLQLKPGMRMLDIGCGWGSLVQFAAERYGVHAVGLTVSKQQAALARQRCAGLSVEIRLQDYREVHEQFDRIASVGMFEHVGHKNHRTYFEMVRRCLKDSGITLLHTIGKNACNHLGECDPWIAKYIFPNSELPTMAHISTASENLAVMEDWHNFGPDYDKTLMAWHRNFTNAWARLRGRYGHRFYRMWEYYLLGCAGMFRSRTAQLWQIVFSKEGLPGGYIPIR